MLDSPMTNDFMTDEERANSDKLEFYMAEKLPVHLTLKREHRAGMKVYLNGMLVRKATDRVWIIKDRKLGEVRVSISEINPNGVYEFQGSLV